MKKSETLLEKDRNVCKKKKERDREGKQNCMLVN